MPGDLKDDMKKILVIGSTGMIGKPVTKELFRASFDMSLLARDLAKTRNYFPLANIIEGDVFNKESLIKAFAGQEELYINLNIGQKAKPTDPVPEREGIDNILEAAKETGIKRIAFLSSLVKNFNGMRGFHWWVFDVKQTAVDKIKASGIPYTIFYASSFMENFDQLLLRERRILLAGKSRSPMWFISGEDYGRQVAWSFAKLTTENKEYAVQGPEPYNWDEAAKVFMANYTRSKLKVVKAPLALMRLLGNVKTEIRYASKIMTALNNYPEKFEAEATWEELGKPMFTLQAYAEKISKFL
jgi:uncharacterized protein YbjT (DUF2867 family)